MVATVFAAAVMPPRGCFCDDGRVVSWGRETAHTRRKFLGDENREKKKPRKCGAENPREMRRIFLN